MRALASLLVMLAAVTACSSVEGVGSLPFGPISWPSGRYVLEASVRYEQSRTGILDELYLAELSVAIDGSMDLTSSSGICLDPRPAEIQRDEAQGRRTFRCGNATYTLRLTAGTISGELAAVVREVHIVRGACIRYSPQANTTRPVCAEYAREHGDRTTTKRFRLRISKVEVRLDP